jgi:glycosyltransferase involved in cell wall biosynthesis
MTIVYESIVVLSRKGTTKPFEIVRNIRDNIKYINHFEGDAVLETEYLLDNQYEPGFYNRDPEEWKREQRRQVETADHISVSTEQLKQNLIERYPDMGVEKNVSVFPELPPTDFCFSESRRDEMRADLGIKEDYVMVYLGNAYYSWQNIETTLAVSAALNERSGLDVFTLLLVPGRDHDIVEGFLAESELEPDEYHLTEIDHDEVNDYLMASDLGIVLRDNHPMNAAAIPGKYLEYLASGLPVLATKVVPLAEEVRENGYGIVLNDVTAPDAIATEIIEFRKTARDRSEISEWIRKRLCVSSYIDEYVAMLESIGSK